MSPVFSPQQSPEAEGIQGRITGGAAAAIGQLPWHVWVRSSVGTASTTCGGALIANNWVLTAAQCVQGYTSYTVGAGSNRLSTPQIQLQASYAIVNPGYVASTFANDVALLMLPTNITTSSLIAPVRLPAVSQTNTTFLNFATTVSGFGRLNNATTVLSENLQVVNLRVMANANCASYYGTAVVNDNAMCGEGMTSTTQGTCIGDAGGPMVIYENNVPTLIGTVSFISGRGCGFGDPSGFARVSKFLTWINAVTGIALRA